MATTKQDVTERATNQPERQRREAELALRPPADIFEREDGIIVQLDMPGVSKERLTLRVDRENLVVEGSAQISMPENMAALHADIRSTRYGRSFALSAELEPDRIEASLKDGVLEIRIPKRAEARPRRINVSTG